jgi:5-methyltetrahydrofolate--homocysteine methyltransferase
MGLNAAFLNMAMASGMTSAITSPLHKEVTEAVMAADVLMGNDADCLRWIGKFRDPTAGAENRSRREGRRRRARA